MKRKDFTELKKKEIKDLLKLSMEKKFEAKKSKLNLISGKDKNLKTYRNMRRDIAQILTVIREKEIIASLQPKEEVKVDTRQASVSGKKKVIKKEKKVKK